MRAKVDKPVDMSKIESEVSMDGALHLLLPVYIGDDTAAAQ